MRAIGYFREISRWMEQQSEAFLDFCKRNSFEAGATFIDTKAESDQPGFRQMVDFVRHMEGNGLTLVVVPDIVTLGSGAVEAMRRYYQLASLNVPIIGVDTGDELSPHLLETWSEIRANGRLGDRCAPRCAQGRQGRGAWAAALRLQGRPAQRLEPVPEEAVVVRYIFRLYLRKARHPPDRPPPERGSLSNPPRRQLEHGHDPRHPAQPRLPGHVCRFGVRVPGSHPPWSPRRTSAACRSG